MNSYFQSQLPDVTVVAFLIFPTKTNNFNVESLRGHAVTKQLRDTINNVQMEVGRRMYDTCLKYAMIQTDVRTIICNSIVLQWQATDFSRTVDQGRCCEGETLSIRPTERWTAAYNYS